MSRTFRNVLVVCVIVMLVAGLACTPRSEPPTTTQPEAVPPIPLLPAEDTTPIFAPPEDLKALAEGNNQFAIDLYKKLAEKSDGNIFFSPYSIRTALGMTYAGARGETAEQMAKTLHFTLPAEKLHPAFGATAQQLKGNTKNPPEPTIRSKSDHKFVLPTMEPFQLTVANALWGQQGLPFQREFLDVTKTNYASGFRELDFAGDTEGSRKTINRWVEEKTKNKIKELLKPDDLSSVTRLVLTNATHFKAAWAIPFLKGETRDALFEITADEKVTVAMMQTQDAHFDYFATDDCEWVKLPYCDRASMLLLLPRKGKLAVVEGKLTPLFIQEALGNIGPRTGKVLLPKFQVRTTAQLNTDLSRLGMPVAFSGNADFSGMVPGGGFKIGSVIHEAYVNVDEVGTEAAAATAVMMNLSNPAPFSFTANRPFLFFICDNKTESILFSGRVVRPTQTP